MLQITDVEMPSVFLIWFIFCELYGVSRATDIPSLDNIVQLYNRKNPKNITANDTINELVGSIDKTNETITESTPFSTSSTSSGVGEEAYNVTQKSNPFTVSRLLEYSALSWLKNEYVMSIVIPIAAGIGCGLFLIILLNICRCVRAKCQRSCHKRNRNLPAQIKQMKLADRMKLLAESSDEEF